MERGRWSPSHRSPDRARGHRRRHRPVLPAQRTGAWHKLHRQLHRRQPRQRQPLHPARSRRGRPRECRCEYRRLWPRRLVRRRRHNNSRHRATYTLALMPDGIDAGDSIFTASSGTTQFDTDTAGQTATVDGGDLGRVFDVANGGVVTISRLVVQTAIPLAPKWERVSSWARARRARSCLCRIHL